MPVEELAAIPEGPLFGSGGRDIDAVEAADELSGHGEPAVGDGEAIHP